MAEHKPWTGWGNTDAINNVDCPKCKAKEGDSCRMPSGRKALTPHVERLVAFSEKYPDYTANRRTGAVQLW